MRLPKLTLLLTVFMLNLVFPASTEKAAAVAGEDSAQPSKSPAVTKIDAMEPLPLLQRYGLLRLNITPMETATLVDGKYLDKNVWLISMKPGTHSLDILKEGYKPYSKVFDISHGDRISFDITLEKQDVTAVSEREVSPEDGLPNISSP